VRAPSQREAGAAAVNQIFRDNKDVFITRDASGMIRITIGKPKSELLRTRIPSLALTPDEQYNAGLAVAAVAKSKAVEAAEHRLGFREPPTVFDMNIVEPGKGLPHVPPQLADITLDQAFDLIAKTFGGIVLYAVCSDSSGTHLVAFDFVGVVGVQAEQSR
jgi:hypothetical protein